MRLSRHIAMALVIASGITNVAETLADSFRVSTRGPGRQLYDERKRVGEPLRILAAYTGMTELELSKIEEGKIVPTPEQWEALQGALPDLGAMEPLPQAEELLSDSSRTPPPWPPSTKPQRGPGQQIRDARTSDRARWSLRDLAECLEIPHVELSEIERNIRPVSLELWAKARELLPELPEVMPPETARPLTDGDREQARTFDAFLHPAGRCTCGRGGGGSCEWCVMDQRRTKREDRLAWRAAPMQEDAPRDLLCANLIEHEKKAKHHKAKQARRRRTGRR